jgi:hypothetical protein
MLLISHPNRTKMQLTCPVPMAISPTNFRGNPRTTRGAHIEGETHAESILIPHDYYTGEKDKVAWLSHT